MLKKLKLLKKPLFQKRRSSCDFPPRKMPVARKHRAISRQEKMAFSAPVGLSWDSPPPPTECVDGQTYGCTDVRTDGHVTITSQPKFFGLIGYHNYFLSNGAPLAGFARRLRYKSIICITLYCKPSAGPYTVLLKSNQVAQTEKTRLALQPTSLHNSNFLSHYSRLKYLQNVKLFSTHSDCFIHLTEAIYCTFLKQKRHLIFHSFAVTAI